MIDDRLLCRFALVAFLSTTMVLELKHSGLPHVEYSIPVHPVVITNTIVSTATASALPLPLIKR